MTEIAKGWKLGREAWPGVDVNEGDFSRYVAERLEDSHASPPWSDLYLACGCARGNADAIRAFDEKVLPHVEAALARVAPSVPVDEVKQLLRHKLFVAGEGATPKIAEYAGRGALRTWLRMVATRTALDLATARAREIPVERDALEHIAFADEDPELDFFKRKYAAQFRTAFADAFASLEPRDRSLLRYAFGRGLGIDVIGTLYGVHRATAARWVVAAHEALGKTLRKTLMERLAVKPDEYASIMRLIESRVEVSFARLLEEKTM